MTRFAFSAGDMSREIGEAKSELEAAQSALEAALRAWDESVSELWRTSLALTQAQKRVTRAYELLRVNVRRASIWPKRPDGKGRT